MTVDAAAISQEFPSRQVPAAATVCCVVLLLIAARLLAAGLVPLDPDETYYRLWSLFPSWAYYDHPAMVAWWMAAGRAIFGDTNFGFGASGPPGPGGTPSGPPSPGVPPLLIMSGGGVGNIR